MRTSIQPLFAPGQYLSITKMPYRSAIRWARGLKQMAKNWRETLRGGTGHWHEWWASVQVGSGIAGIYRLDATVF